MQTYRAITVAGLASVWLAMNAWAQDIVIESFDHNGIIIWTNAQINVAGNVEWASSLTGTWSRSWSSLSDMHITAHENHAFVPMFYRVTCSTSSVVTERFLGTGYDLMGSSSFDYDLRLKIVGAAARGSIAIIQDSIYNFGVFPLMNGLAERGAVSFVAYRDDHRFHYYFTLAKEGTNLTGGVVELDYGSSNAPIRSGITAVGLFTVPATNDPSLVAYYPFNGNAHDEAGNGHDGTVYGARLATDQFGFADSAYSFDGTNSFIQVPHHADLNVSPSGFTVAGWFKANPVQLDPGALYDIVDKSHWSGDQLGWTIQARTADWGTEGIDFTFAGTGAGVDAPVFDDQWHHFGATHDGTNAAFYLDGTLRQTGPTPLPGANGRDLFIGMHYQVQRHFRGIIDEVRIYRRSLAPNEMAQLYQNP